MDCTQVTGLAINLGSLRTPHRVRAIKGRLQANAFNPAMHQPGILASGYVRTCMKSTWERYREPVARSIGSHASTELLDCSVISNWTGRPVFFWTIVARCRTFTPEQTSSNRSLTRSQARSLLSIARLKIARSRLDRAISRRTRMDQTCFGSRGFFLADEQSLVPRLLASVDRTCRHRGVLRRVAL